MAQLDKVFKAAINFNASDVHIVPGEPFMIRRLARMVKMKSEKLSLGILAYKPDFVLYRPDENLEYHFTEATGKRLLNLNAQ